MIKFIFDKNVLSDRTRRGRLLPLVQCGVDRNSSASVIIADSAVLALESIPMRNIMFAPAFLIISSFALAHGAPRIDLDQPDALSQLKQQHPQRYQAVTAVLRASEHTPCEAGEIEVLKTRFNVRDLECGMMIYTSYPAKRHVSFELDGTQYAATVVLKDAESVQPIALVTEWPAH
jgi:hypothetical protein